MQESSPSRPGFRQWLLFLVLACWLALVPLAVVFVLTALSGSPPDLLVQLGLATPRDPAFPQETFGLVATLSTLGLHLAVFLPLYLVTRRPGREFLHNTATLLIAIALFQTLNALAGLAVLLEGWGQFSPVVGPDTSTRTLVAALRLAILLLLLLVGMAGLEANRQGVSLPEAWRRVGLRLWFNPSVMWLALGAAATIVWPWVLVGSLGSLATTAGNAVQALPSSLGGEILFRGFAFAWLWRAAAAPPQSPPHAGGSSVNHGTEPASAFQATSGKGGRSANHRADSAPAPQTAPGRGGRPAGAVGSLILFVAAQGGGVLPTGNWDAVLQFAVAFSLGLLVTELTIRAGGSVWPAIVVHSLYVWVPLAFVDPRSREEVLHWLVQVWMPLAAGGLGLILWLGRKVAQSWRSRTPLRLGRSGLGAPALFAVLCWLGIAILYVAFGAPGFHPDGFLIFLEEQADLSPAASIVDPVERRTRLYGTLTETAARTQAALWAELDRRGVAYRPHYLINMVEVQGRPGLRHTFAGWPGVASVLYQPGMRRYPHSFRIPDLDPGGPNGVEWNLREIGADRVWDLGYTGQAVIVGDADTGVAWDHPALKASYMGWAEGTASHDYHWFDAWDGRAEPWDDNGHGTHTTGTLVGLDGDNQVGVAPGARWIACRNMRHGLGNPGSYLSCMEFLLAPIPHGGDPLQDGDPSRGAQVVNNSWGCPQEEGCLPDTLRVAMDNLRVAGQMMVVSAGNDGPDCGTVQHVPAIYEAGFSVGAINRSDESAGFSSRGPVTVDGSQRAKPDIVAPGVDVRSSVPGGYASVPGTSMAGPHVAGAVALLWSIEPDLIGDIERTEAILAETAQPLTVDKVCAAGNVEPGTVCACGDDLPETVPNQVYGWGQVDVWAAAQMLLGGD